MMVNERCKSAREIHLLIPNNNQDSYQETWKEVNKLLKKLKGNKIYNIKKF